MKKYKPAGADTGVAAYEAGEDYIKLKFFGTTHTYTYSYKKAGSYHVENMKEMAQNGKGLNTYINKYVKDLYD